MSQEYHTTVVPGRITVYFVLLGLLRGNGTPGSMFDPELSKGHEFTLMGVFSRSTPCVFLEKRFK
jgi:hypothetical protein